MVCAFAFEKISVITTVGVTKGERVCVCVFVFAWWIYIEMEGDFVLCSLGANININTKN